MACETVCYPFCLTGLTRLFSISDGQHLQWGITRKVRRGDWQPCEGLPHSHVLKGTKQIACVLSEARTTGRQSHCKILNVKGSQHDVIRWEAKLLLSPDFGVAISRRHCRLIGSFCIHAKTTVLGILLDTPPNNSDYAKVDSLLKAARTGDATALSTLFGLYQNYICLLAASQIRARLRVRASESDVVQETLLNATRGFSEFRGTTGGEFVTWLRAILTRKIQTLIQTHVDTQARDVRREVSLETVGRWLDQSSMRLENVLIANDLSAGTQLANHESSIRVADALAQLSEDHREVLMLRSIEGLGFPEVAERLERSHGAVRMLWLRAVEALRDKLDVENER